MGNLILAPLTAIKALVTSLTSDDGSIIQRVWSAPPAQPADEVYPTLALEVAWDQPNTYKLEANGLGRWDYFVQGYIFVGAPGTVGDVATLHDRAAAWVKPLSTALVANMKLQTYGITGFIAIGNSTGEFFQWWIQGIQWNAPSTNLYGLRFLLPITQKMTQTMG